VILIGLLPRALGWLVELRNRSMFGFHAVGSGLSEGEERTKGQRPLALFRETWLGNVPLPKS